MSHEKEEKIICPHCGYEFDTDSMISGNYDLYAIAPREEHSDVMCPTCMKDFVVVGEYQPFYRTYKTMKEFEDNC